jgi:hypothetical protein
MKARVPGERLGLCRRSLSSFFLLLLVGLFIGCQSSPAPASQTTDDPPVASSEETDESGVSKAQVEKYQEVKKAVKEEKIEKLVEQDQTGNDPRAFGDRWMPYYRYTDLKGGVTQQDLTAFGSFGFNERLGMFYELPLAQYRDFSDVKGLPADAEKDAIGVGDMDLKFLWRPEGTEFTYGEDDKMNFSLLLGTDFVLPTATDDALAGDSLLFAPIVGAAWDMPLHGFIAMLNLYYLDLYKADDAPDTSRFVSRIFYMQPLTPPGEWWGLFYLMPEFQPVYDFETKDWSTWLGLEFGKVLAPGRVLYVKPGWGMGNSEAVDRDFTLEVGFRWYF